MEVIIHFNSSSCFVFFLIKLFYHIENLVLIFFRISSQNMHVFPEKKTKKKPQKPAFFITASSIFVTIYGICFISHFLFFLDFLLLKYIQSRYCYWNLCWPFALFLNISTSCCVIFVFHLKTLLTLNLLQKLMQII